VIFSAAWIVSLSTRPSATYFEGEEGQAIGSGVREMVAALISIRWWRGPPFWTTIVSPPPVYCEMWSAWATDATALVLVAAA